MEMILRARYLKISLIWSGALSSSKPLQFTDSRAPTIRLDLSKKVELFMSDILVALIEESPGLPSGVLEILLEQFTSKNSVGSRSCVSRLRLSHK